MVFLCLLFVLPFSGFFPEFSGLNVDSKTEIGINFSVGQAATRLLFRGQPHLCSRLPCRVSPEREDLVDTEDCTEVTDVVSPMVLSVMKPPPSPSVWTVIVD